MNQYNLDHGRKRAFALMIPNIPHGLLEFHAVHRNVIGMDFVAGDVSRCGQFKNVAVNVPAGPRSPAHGSATATPTSPQVAFPQRVSFSVQM
jgi:hypothetical protein